MDRAEQIINYLIETSGVSEDVREILETTGFDQFFL